MALVGGLLAFFVFVVYGRSIGFPFVDWDDRGYLLANPLVAHPLLAGWRTFLLTPQMGYPQPVTLLSQHLDFLLGGGAAWAFHLGNLVLHIANVLLLLCILRSYAVPRLAATVACLIFAVHPIVAEPVCWATGRKDLLAAAFVLGGFWVYRRRPTSWVVVPVLLLAELLAFGAKAVAVVLPALVAADVAIYKVDWGSPGRRFSRVPGPVLAALVVTGLVALAGVAVAYTTQFQHGAIDTSWSVDARLRYLSQHLLLQVRNYLVPSGLVPKYLQGFPLPLLSSYGIGGLVAVLSLMVAIVVCLRMRAQMILLALAWFAICFAPSSGVLPLNRGPADTYMYLPGIGLAICIGLAVAWLAACRSQLRLLRARWVATAVCAIYGFAGYVQADLWRSSTALWRSVWQAFPENRGSWWAYADALIGEGRYRQAIELYEQGLRRFPYPPATPEVITALGLGSTIIGDMARASHWYGEAVRHFPPDPGTALRFLAMSGRYADPAYAAERAVAQRVAAQALGALAHAPASEQPSRLRDFFQRYLAQDRVPEAGLDLYRDDPVLGDVARRLARAYQPPSRAP